MIDLATAAAATKTAHYGAKLAQLFSGKRAKIRQRFKFYTSRYFYDEVLVKAFLFERNLADLPETQFIHYGTYTNLYPSVAKKCRILAGDDERELILPYKEEINFINSPDTQITVDVGIENYTMPDALRALTEPNLQAFLKKQPHTRNNPILRMRSLTWNRRNHYSCVLQKAEYFDQVRTNLTLDLPIRDKDNKALRVLDLTETRELPSLEDSKLINSIGVSAVCYFRKVPSSSTDRAPNFFFMKLRKPTEAVFGNMFGTTSGVVTLHAGQGIGSLVDYVTSEMRREFYRETGLDEETNPIQTMYPLAFTRELMRGGKPQFFFLIEIDPISEDLFGKRFRSSAEGLEEFYDNVYRNNLYSSTLSPEFVMNLIYALQWFQKQRGIDVDPVRLGQLNLSGR